MSNWPDNRSTYRKFPSRWGFTYPRNVAWIGWTHGLVFGFVLMLVLIVGGCVG